MSGSISVLKKITQRQTTQDVVYEQLRATLIAGGFEAGQPLKISDLARGFGTSNMPVREALKRLSAEGALVIGTSGTAMVPLTSARHLANLSRTRCILEGAAAAAAAPRFTDPHLARIVAANRLHCAAFQAGNLSETLEHNRAFHFLIYETADNPVLLSLIENLWLRYGPYVRLLSARLEELIAAWHNAYSPHHDRLIDALTARDPEAARAAMEADINATQALMLKLQAFSGG